MPAASPGSSPSTVVSLVVPLPLTICQIAPFWVVPSALPTVPTIWPWLSKWTQLINLTRARQRCATNQVTFLFLIGYVPFMLFILGRHFRLSGAHANSRYGTVRNSLSHPHSRAIRRPPYRLWTPALLRQKRSSSRPMRHVRPRLLHQPCHAAKARSPVRNRRRGMR
jgi:hypothetical protein